MKIKLNKKGADKMLAMYWFVMLLIIAGGIFGMVYSFYHHPYDVREVEANIMINHVADCLSTQGIINKKLIDNNGEFNQAFENTFFENCHLTFDVEESLEDKYPYYLSGMEII